MIRFFVDETALNAETAVLTGENARHAKVLRLRAGEEVLLCDGAGREALCRVETWQGDDVCLTVTEQRQGSTEAQVAVSVYMAFPKADKLEHVIQKATELGASEIVAFPSSRCVFKAEEKSIAKKLERWQKIAASAAEQSGRCMIPRVVTLGSYKEALQRAALADKKILFFEHEKAVTLRMALEESRFSSIAILTGPEGGLSDTEVEQARQAGLQVCTLGSRILRCETAPLCALSAIMYHVGEF